MRYSRQRWGIAVVVLVGLLVLCAPSCPAAKTKKTAAAGASKTPQVVAAAEEIPAFVAFKDELEKFLGVPYRFGGYSPKGMDCSGFAKRFFAEAFGIELPHNSRAISHLDFLDDLPADPLLYRPSDLLFFGPAKGRINHVGIYLGEGKFVHASRRKGVTVSSIQNSYWKRRLLASKRVTVLDEAQLTTLAAAGHGLPADGIDGEPISDALALGYYQSLIDNRLGIGLQGMSGSQAFESSRHFGDARPAAWPSFQNEHYHGWRALVDIRPSDWLCITPWLGHLDVDDGISGASGALGHYGLKTSIQSAASPWSLSMAAQTTHFHDWVTASTASDISDWRSMDFGFDVGYRLGSSYSLSLSGWRSGLQSGFRDDLPETLSDVVLRLNIEF